MAMHFFNFCLDHVEGPDSSHQGAKIECLPKQNAAKLPLGIHWSSNKFCGFVDPLTLVPSPNPYEYVLSIQPDNTILLDSIKRCKTQHNSHPRKNKISEQWDSVATELAYRIGITKQGTRHRSLLQAAAYVRNTPSLCPETFDEFLQLLISWSEKQYRENRGNIRTNFAAHLRDVKQVAKYVWNHPFTPGLQLKIPVRAAILHWVRSQTPTLATQQLLFAAWYQSEVVNGSFFFGYERMKDLTGLAKDSLDRAIKELRDERKILIMVKNYSHSLNVVKSKVRQYRLKDKVQHSSIGSPLIVITPDIEISTLWFQLLRTLVSETELKKDYPFSWHRIMKAYPMLIE